MSEYRNNSSGQKEKTKLAEDIASKGKAATRNYARFELGLIRFFRWLSSLIDRLLFNNRRLFLSSLVLAIILVLALNFSDAQMLTSNRSVEVLENIKVEVNVNDEIFEVKGIPEEVKVYVIGEISDLQLIQSSNNLRVVADLSGLMEGKQQITLRPVDYSSRVQVNVDPSTVVVTIARKASKSLYFDYEFINKDKADPMYAFGTPTFNVDQVYVRASQETLDEISQVKALIDVNGVIGDFTQEVLMVAYNQQGERMKVEIMPINIEATVPVSTPHKTVPILIQPMGNIPDNKSIDTVTLDHQSITIYGENQVLDKIENVVIPLDVSKLMDEKTESTARVILPSGVRKADISSVHFTIKTGPTIDRRITGVNLRYIGYDDDNYKIAPVNPLDANVEVVISGTKQNVDKVKADDINAYLDFSVIALGRQSLPVLVSGTNYLVRYVPVKDMIDIDVVGK